MQPRERSIGRGSERLRLRLEAPGSSSGAEASKVLIHNLSATGMLLEMPSPPRPGSDIAVFLPEAGDVSATVVWTSDSFVGCRFAQPLSSAALSAALLRNPIEPDLPDDGGTQGSVRETFADRLIRLRQARGLSRAELAERAGVSKPTMWAWETGRTPPRQSNLASLARALRVSEEVLLGLTSSAAVASSAADRPASPTALAQAVAESKVRIAELAGTEPERVKISVEL